MVTRGRGVGRGRERGRNVPPQPLPPRHISPPLQPSQHSPSTTSTTGPLTSESLPTSIPLTTGGASTSVSPLTDPPLSIPPPANPPTSSSNVVPSSEKSHIETDKRELIYVAVVHEPRRFLPPRVTHDIMYNVMTRMSILANTWRDYSTNMKDILFKEFMIKLKHPISYRDLYAKVNKKKYENYVSEHSKNFIEPYDTMMLEKYRKNYSTHPMIDLEVWLDVAGPNKKGRVHDISNSLYININNTIHVSSPEVALIKIFFQGISKGHVLY